ncbi:hypothetical protein [Nostoc commune]|uniref:hypothetical protein n=1 Tax=Nostoc commune TaxID=1178 RepID=UPI0018C514F5|nr:hypothetical protein [Nostoc commune]MBG1261447.1 hypothetical protein [Nostoc commune BAE]
MNLPQLRVFTFAVIRGFMPLGVAQSPAPPCGSKMVCDSWLYAVRRCSNIEVKLLTAIAEVI